MPENELAPIQQRVMEFIRKRFNPGFNHYNVSKLVGDASSRQYYRFLTDDGDSLILAAYPEAFDPEHFTYKQIYDVLQEIEVPVPEILEMDGRLGIVLQEDLGNESLQKVLRNTAERPKALLLRRAIDHILNIQDRGTRAFHPGCEGFGLAFDEAKLNWEFDFFRKHYLRNYRKSPDAESTLLSGEFSLVSAELAASPRVLCHRDFHVRNLMVKDGILYVIDFQDARWGPPSYDLASLVKDSIELETGQVEELVRYYLDEVHRAGCLGFSATLFEPPEFERQFHLMCIQRMLKALGTYAYQIIVRQNFIYEQYMAGSLHRALVSAESIGGFPETERMVETELKDRAG